MRWPRIGFVTNEAYPNLHADDRIAADLLCSFADVVPIVWTVDGVSEIDAAVLRSSWDSHLEPERFLTWLSRAASKTRLFNSFRLMNWNFHKGYLLELGERGVPVIPTTLYARGTKPNFVRDIERFGSSDIVIKPAVSASAYKTARFSATELSGAAAFLAELLAERDALVQPLRPEVFTTGERSAVYIDGRFSHVVRRLPFGAITPNRAAGADAVPFTSVEQRFADGVLDCLPETPLYARVDYIISENGPLLMELELIDPSLFFQHHEPAAGAFVDALRRRCTN